MAAERIFALALLAVSGSCAEESHPMDLQAEAIEPDAGVVSADLATGVGSGADSFQAYALEEVVFDQIEDEPHPLLLFGSGYATLNVDQATASPSEVASDFAEFPGSWMPWRRSSGGVEVGSSGQWRLLPYAYQCTALPAGTSVAGTFDREDEVIVQAGNVAVATRTRYRFDAGGTFERCTWKTNIVAQAGGLVEHECTEQSGRYDVDGYTIRFHFSGGEEDTLPFFYDPARPNRVWIRSHYFPVSESANTDLCQPYSVVARRDMRCRMATEVD